MTETRSAGKHTMRRRRQCTACKQRFTTLEQIAPPALRVEKRRGGTEPYQRAKLTRCFERVCRHRGIGDDVIEDRVEHIEAELSRAQARAVRWSRLVELVLDALGGVDRVAQQRMAANYVDDAGVLRLDEAASRQGPEPQLPLFE